MGGQRQDDLWPQVARPGSGRMSKEREGGQGQRIIHLGDARQAVTLGIDGKDLARDFLLDLLKHDRNRFESIRTRIRAISNHPHYENKLTFRHVGEGVFGFSTTGPSLSRVVSDTTQHPCRSPHQRHRSPRSRTRPLNHPLQPPSAIGSFRCLPRFLTKVACKTPQGWVCCLDGERKENPDENSGTHIPA